MFDFVLTPRCEKYRLKTSWTEQILSSVHSTTNSLKVKHFTSLQPRMLWASRTSSHFSLAFELTKNRTKVSSSSVPWVHIHFQNSWYWNQSTWGGMAEFTIVLISFYVCFLCGCLVHILWKERCFVLHLIQFLTVLSARCFWHVT